MDINLVHIKLQYVTHPTNLHTSNLQTSRNNTNPETNMTRQHLHQTIFDFNQSVVDLFRHQMELAHSTQSLHQLTTDALHIAKSSSLQENLNFINDNLMFKAKDPQLFDE